MKTLSTMAVPARLDNLEKIVQSVSAIARDEGLSEEKISDLELAVEEVMVNICSYSYPDSQGGIEVICKSDAGNFVVEFIDSGIPFDIRTLSDPDLTPDLDKRKIGGLGIFLVKKLMDDIRYKREKDRNILSLYLKKDG